MKAAIYLRQSQDKTGEGLAVDRQREECQRICSERGWSSVEYVDNDKSATSGKPRPRYTEMLDDIRNGTVDAVVVWDLDRLHRRPIELETFMELADTHRLALATVTGDVDLSTDNGRLFARIKGAVAKGEVERKSVRQKAAAKQRATNGQAHSGGRRAFGYEPGNTQVNGAEAKLIREAYTAVIAGESLYSVAAQWNKAGITSTAGNQWIGSTVRQVLVNPRYVAKRFYLGEEVADADWPPIVSSDVWHAAVTILSDTGRRRDRAPGRKYLLTGILRCGQCGASMGSGVADSSRATIYVCKHCHRLSRRQSPVDDAVVALTVAYLSQPDAVNILVDTEREDITELRQQERAFIDRLDGMAVDYANGDLTARQLKIATEKVEGQLADVRSRMADSNRARVFDGWNANGAVGEWFGGLSLDRRRAIVDTLMRVTLLPGGRGRPFVPEHLRVEWLTGDD